MRTSLLKSPLPSRANLLNCNYARGMHQSASLFLYILLLGRGREIGRGERSFDSFNRKKQRAPGSRHTLLFCFVLK